MLVLIPLDNQGNAIEQENYECSVLKELEADLILTEKHTVTTTRQFVFSKDGANFKNENTESKSVKKPFISIDNAVSIIENWRNNAMEWINMECNKYNGQRIFRQFFVPLQDIQSENLTKSICTFALKQSESFNKVLPTLVFINQKQIENLIDIEIFDWTRPSPPYTTGGGGWI